MKNEILKITNYSYHIGYKKILKNISFSIYENDCVLLTGENGAGKSTLLKSILAYHKFEDSIIPNYNKDESYFISFLGHEAGLYSTLSLRENIDYFYGILKYKVSLDFIDELLNRFQLKKRLDDPIYTFSKGMKQKAGIIRALLPISKLYLLDEPFSGLDSNSTNVLLEIFNELKTKYSLVIVSHDINILTTVYNRRVHLISGEISNDPKFN